MEKLFCNKCKGLRNQNIIADKQIHGGEDDYNYFWTEEYKIIQCLGCDHISFLKVYSDNSMIRPLDDNDYEYYDVKNVYPYYLEKGSEISNKHYLPEKIKEIYIETISAFKAKAYLLTAAGLRAIIDAVCNYLKIKGNYLADRIDLLHSKGHLTSNESKRLHSIRFLGNDAIHKIQTPKIDQLVALLDIINHLLSNLFINDKILKGKIDTVIDDFDEFFIFFQSAIKKEMIQEIIEVEQILGKSIRRIAKGKLTLFIDEINNRINKGEIRFLEIIESNKKAHNCMSSN